MRETTSTTSSVDVLREALERGCKTEELVA